MSLEDTIEQLRYKKAEEPCPLQKTIDKLNDKDKEALANAVKKGIPDSTLAMALRKEGYKISEQSISAHRRGVCRCKKK